MRIECPACATSYHVDFLGLSKRGPQDKHVVGCVCGTQLEVTFSEREVEFASRSRMDRLMRRKKVVTKTEVIPNVSITEV